MICSGGSRLAQPYASLPMDPRFTSSFSWYRALTLAERAAITPLPTAGGDDATVRPALPVAMLPLVEAPNGLTPRRLVAWRSQPPFDSGPYLDQRLAQDNLDQARLQQIVTESAEDLQRRLSQAPAWLEELARAYARPATAYASPPPGEEVLGFLELVQPLVDRACARLATGVAELVAAWPTLPLDPDTVEDVLLMNLPDPLLMRLGRTMVLELNVARLQGLLPGDTPQERFQSFIESLRQPDRTVAILAEYPVLARQLALCIERWADVALEFLGRLCTDWDAIRACFSPTEDPGPLVELVGGAGDTHRGGRSVMVALFESGFRIVYKPKSLSIDVHFQELLAWLNQQGDLPPFRTLAVLDQGEYGWVEFVERGECSSISEIERFYHRLGAYLALLYALNATDFHLENLIAAGEQPVLIDLETLFHPEFDPAVDAASGAAADAVAVRQMADSVLQVGLLPQRLWSAEEYLGIDISGLGGEPGQLSPDRVPLLADPGTDTMRYVRERIELPGEANRPVLDGQEVSALGHVEDIVRGFTAMYRLLVDHQAELLAADGPLARFRDDEIRVLLRPTRTYDQLLFESFHPDMLRDALDRDLLMDRLWLVVPARLYMARAIAAEQAEMQAGDIPIFTTRPGSLDLWSGQDQVVTGVLTETGVALLERRLRQLGDEDLRRQLWFIRSSLGTLAQAEPDADRPAAPAYQLRMRADSRRRASRDRLLREARAVAERLSDTAVFGQEDVTWLGLVRLDDSQASAWDLAPLGMDLYGGVPGVALFLAYAGRLLAEERYSKLSRRAFRGIAQHVQQFGGGQAPEPGAEPISLPGVGGFEGWGGILYALTHLAALWQDEDALTRAAQAADALARVVDQDTDYTVARGAAGGIAALLAYHHYAAAGQALAAARACGDHLLASGRPLDAGLGWAADGEQARPLGGFAHGASGIAWALLKLASVTGEERYQQAAQQAIAYERSLYVPDAGNWLDLRQANRPGAEPDIEPAHFSVAWCHGAAGIGLARLHRSRNLDDPELNQEIDVALRTTLAHGFGQSHCLCHGDLGNLELLLQAGRALGDSRWRGEADRVADMVLDSIDRHGWQCGGPQGVEMPGLMLGLAGMGYQLLRLAEPELVPSLLLLDPPVR